VDWAFILLIFLYLLFSDIHTNPQNFFTIWDWIQREASIFLYLCCLSMILEAWGSKPHQMVSKLCFSFGWLFNQNLQLYEFNPKFHIHFKSIPKNPHFDFPNHFSPLFHIWWKILPYLNFKIEYRSLQSK